MLSVGRGVYFVLWWVWVGVILKRGIWFSGCGR